MKKIAVGSQNPIKIEAVESVVQKLWPGCVVVALDAPSGVSAMPLSDQECQVGAQQRAQWVQKAAGAKVGLGLEGGVAWLGELPFITGWVAAVGPSGRVSLASTGYLPLPHHLAEQVRGGAELGQLMDKLVNEHNTKQKSGAIGILTNGVVSRQMAFAQGVAYALAPFLHPELYQMMG